MTDGVHTTSLQRVALVVFGLVLALVALEVTLRAAGTIATWQMERRNAAGHDTGTVVNVLCLGESTTALGGDDSYPARLQLLLDARAGRGRFHVVNAGVPGITTAVVLERLPALLERWRPAIVVTMLGINDGLMDPDHPGGARLPAFTGLKVAKLAHLAWLHVRAAWDQWRERRAISAPVARAREQATRGDRAGAEATLVAALHDTPGDVEAAYLLAVVRFADGRFADARTVLEDARKAGAHDDRIDRTILQARIAAAGVAFEQRRLDEAQQELEAVLPLVPKDDVQTTSTVLGLLVAVDTVRGDTAAAERRRRELESRRAGAWLASTEDNYRAIVRQLLASGITPIAVQYPMRSVAQLQALLSGIDGVRFVDSTPAFRAALAHGPWSALFTDAFAGDFGHFTSGGAQLLAEQVAVAVLAIPVDRPPASGR